MPGVNPVIDLQMKPDSNTFLDLSSLYFNIGFKVTWKWSALIFTHISGALRDSWFLRTYFTICSQELNLHLAVTYSVTIRYIVSCKSIKSVLLYICFDGLLF